MWNSINTVADSNRFNRDEFKAFALKNISKYSLDVVLKAAPAADQSNPLSPDDIQDIFVSNWYADDMAEEFRSTCQEFVFQLESSYGMPKLTVWASNLKAAEAVAEKFSESNGYFIHPYKN